MSQVVSSLVYYIYLLIDSLLMGMKISVILVENLLATLMAILVQLQSFHFLHKIHSNALSLGKLVLDGNEKL